MDTSESPVLLLVVLAAETLAVAVVAALLVVRVIRSRDARRPPPAGEAPDHPDDSLPTPNLADQLWMGLFVSVVLVVFFLVTAWLWSVTLLHWSG